MPPSPANAGEGAVCVFLRAIEVDVRCGLHAWERYPEPPNRLLVDVEMRAPWPLPGADAGAHIDYDRVRRHVAGWKARPHTDLLETLLTGLVDFIFEDPLVCECRVSVSKPDIFSDVEAAGVELTCRRPTAA